MTTTDSFARSVFASLPPSQWCVADVEGLDDGESGAPADFARVVTSLLLALVPGCCVAIHGEEVHLTCGASSTTWVLATRNTLGVLSAVNSALAAADEQTRVFLVWSCDLGQAVGLFVASEASAEPWFEELLTRPSSDANGDSDDDDWKRDRLCLHQFEASRIV